MKFATEKEREQFILNNMGLVGYVIKRLYNYTEDLFQEGCVELIKCVDNFNEEGKIAFSTYACESIKLHLLRYINTCNKIIKPSSEHLDACPKVKYLEDILPPRSNMKEDKREKVESKLFSDRTSDFEEDVINDIFLDDLLNKSIKSQKDKDIFMLYLSGKYTQKEIGDMYGVTKSNINRIIKENQAKWIKKYKEGRLDIL